MTPLFVDRIRQGVVVRAVRRWAAPGSGFVHGFSDRRGGVSEPPFHRLNVAFHVGDDRDAVRANRALLCRAFGAAPDALVAGRQVHGHRIAVVTEKDKGKGAFGVDDALPGVDGLVTDTPGVLLIAFFADCTPILLFDPERPAVGVVHAGWKGTAFNAAGWAVAAMEKAFGSRPEVMEAAIGPAIGPCCYEVGEEVAARIGHAAGFGNGPDGGGRDVVVRREGRLYADLPGANARLLRRAGLAEANVFVDDVCTRCRADRFFSHRAEPRGTGRFAAVIGLDAR